MSAFSTALTGLNANSQAINTVSTNLSNLNTYGYQDVGVSFNDVLNGVTAGNSSSFSQGSMQTTGQPFDAAIQGNGFFVLNASDGSQTFTRDGNFSVNASGVLNLLGQPVLGWKAVNGAVSTVGAATPITIPTGSTLPPKATSNFSVSANLSADAATGATFSSPIQVFDSLGKTHTLTVTYTQTAPGSWSYAVTIPTTDVSGGSGATTSVGTGTLTFNSAGQLTSPAATGAPVNITVSGLANGAADLSLTWNLYNSAGTPAITQYSGASANTASSQDGAAAAQLTSTAIGADGTLNATYSNGATLVVGQLALASIVNPDSMRDLGNNTFAVTSATAAPSIGISGTGGRGTVTGGLLESSTVDIAKEFTNLLTYERGYQANSKVISTEDNITQSTVGLIQG